MNYDDNCTFTEIGDLVVDKLLPGTAAFDVHPLLGLARVHGLGVLTGAAAAIIDTAAKERADGGSGAQFEDDMIEVITFAILAILHQREADHAAIDHDGCTPPRSTQAPLDFGVMRSGDSIPSGIPGVNFVLL